MFVSIKIVVLVVMSTFLIHPSICQNKYPHKYFFSPFGGIQFPHVHALWETQVLSCFLTIEGTLPFSSMIGENLQLVTDEPVEFEK